MKKALSALLSIVLIAVTFAGCSKAKEVSFTPNGEDGDISVVSFNVAAPWGNLIKGTDKNKRVKRFAAYMNAVKPDIIGTQEMSENWMTQLGELMSDYDCYGVKRGGDDKEENCEFNTIYWQKSKYDCIEKKTFWLSETPDTESRYKDAGCNRVCTYVMLEEIETGRHILALNTHLDNASEEARTFGAQLIINELEKYEIQSTYDDYAVVLTGDFNQILESESVQTIDAKLDTIPVQSNTYTDWGKITQGEPIDFVFTNKTPVYSQLLDDKTNGFVSDHFGVYSVIEF